MNLLSSLLTYTARQIAALRAKDTSQDTEISGAKGRLTTAESNISTLTSRIETAISAVTTDTEVTDIRVGDDGVTYTTAGTAVRKQFSDLKSDLSQVDQRLTPIDGIVYINPSDFETGTIYANGTTQVDYNYSSVRIRTNQSKPYNLKMGDVLSLSGSGVRFFVVTKKDDNWYMSGWNTSNYIMPYDGLCAVVIGYNPEVTITDANKKELLSRFSITRSVTPLSKVQERSISSAIVNYSDILVDEERIEFAAVSSGTWQSGENFRINHIPCKPNDIFHAVATASNGYGTNFIGFSFYATSDRSGSALWNTFIGSADFNSNLEGSKTVPSGATEVDITVVLISTSFGDHTPSAGDVAYIDNLVIYQKAIALRPFVGIPAIEALDQSAIYTLQKNWVDKIQDIQNAQEGKFTFAVQTDTHFGEIGTGVYAEQYADLQNNLSKLTEYVGFDFICNLGDIVRGYTGDTTEKMLEAYTEIMHRYVTNLRCPLLVTLGNHDTNLTYAEEENDPSLQISKETLYSKVIPFVKNSTPNAVFNGRSIYYYVDFDDADIRVIMLNTVDGVYNSSGFGSVYTFSQEQITWFTDVALDTDKNVVFMCHVPLVSDLTPNTVSGGTDVLNALKEFKNNGGKLVGCFYGHTHEQDSATVDGILHIAFTNGGNCTEIVMIDTDNKTINTIGVGKDLSNTTVADRAFTYS